MIKLKDLLNEGMYIAPHFLGDKIMAQFHIDEPREIGKQKVKISKKDMMIVKDELQEKVLRKKIREIVMQNLTESKSKLKAGKNIVEAEVDYDEDYITITLYMNKKIMQHTTITVDGGYVDTETANVVKLK